MSEKVLKVGITHGDINGTGYEMIIKTLSDSRILELCVPVVYGSAKVAGFHRKAMELPQINMNIINKAEDVAVNRINIINCVQDEVKVDFSKPTPESYQAAMTALNQAVQDLKKGMIDVLLMSPIHKQIVPGNPNHHDSYLELLEQKTGTPGKSLIIMVKDNLRIGLATGQIPISQVSGLLTKELIVEKLTLFKQTLIHDFCIRSPRIAILCLNPYEEESREWIKEESDIINPAIEMAGQEGIMCFGPYASDRFFGTGKYLHFDGILAMYYDQGLIPFRTLLMEDGVIYIAGLEHICTAPVHGPLFELAGKKIASEDSFRNAMYLSIDLFRNRKTDRKINSNPLKKEYVERGSDNELLDLSNEES